MSLVGEYPDQFGMYIPAARRKRFAEFKEHVSNEGKNVNDVILDLCDGYMKFEPETEE